MLSLQRTFHYLNGHPIARRNKFRAYWNFVDWQIRSRLHKDKFYSVPFVGGTKVWARHHLTGITGSIYTGLQDFEEMAFFLHLLRAEDCFFDVGANVGAYTVLASGVRHCHTVAFEPNPATYDVLRRNIVLNGLEPFTTLENKGVGSKPGTLRFTTGGDTTNHVLADDETDQASSDVEIIPLDRYAGVRQPLAMKIDVEGFETEVIAGGDALLRHQGLKALCLELNGSGGRYGFDEEALHQRLLRYGFQPFQYEPFKRTLNMLPGHGAFNTLYLRDLPFVTQRISESQRFRIWNTEF